MVMREADILDSKVGVSREPLGFGKGGQLEGCSIQVELVLVSAGQPEADAHCRWCH